MQFITLDHVRLCRSSRPLRSPDNHDVTIFMHAAKAAVEAGKVKAIGLSEASAPKIREVSPTQHQQPMLHMRKVCR